MPDRSKPKRRHASRASQPAALRVIGLAAILGSARIVGANAFPLLDVTDQSPVPQGTELAAPDIQDLNHQLQIVNGLSAPPGGGWTFVPRIDLQEMLTDNVLQRSSPRRADLVTYIAPGFSLAGDLPRLQLNFSYTPTLTIYAVDGPLNSLSQQFSGVGTLTLVPDLAFVDVRAVSGVRNPYGGIGGLGGLGATAAASVQYGVADLAGNTAGLNRNNAVQTTSFGISPYLLEHFRDWGTGKLGYSLDVTRSDTVSGFAAPPYPAGGTFGSTLITNEELAQFVSGDILSRFQNTIDLDAQQGQSSNDAIGGIPARSGTSRRSTASDQVAYAVSHTLQVFVSGGFEDIYYSQGYDQGQGQSINDLTWSVGTTWTPSPDSQLTVSYGHRNGVNSLFANGHYQLTPRTQAFLSYGTTLGSQLEYVQNQLNLASANNGGTLVNGQTGGQLFGATNALAVQNGIFRTTSLNVGTTTTLDRDIITFNMLLATQTTTSGATSSVESKTFGASWIHQMRPTMILNAAVSYAVQTQTSGAVDPFNIGSNTSMAASLAWQDQITRTVSISLRYSFQKRQGATASIYNFYQNMLILGLAKTF